MKAAQDPRHRRRERIIKSLFEWGFNPETAPRNEQARKIVLENKKINAIIHKNAPEWPLAQINRVDLAILRLAIYELLIEAKEPPKVIIDEAVELAKKYSSEKSPGFINGVLGTIFKQEDKNGSSKPKS